MLRITYYVYDAIGHMILIRYHLVSGQYMRQKRKKYIQATFYAVML